MMGGRGGGRKWIGQKEGEWNAVDALSRRRTKQRGLSTLTRRNERGIALVWVREPGWREARVSVQWCREGEIVFGKKGKRSARLLEFRRRDEGKGGKRFDPPTSVTESL